MNDLRIKSVSFPENTFKVEFSDGRCIAVPLDHFARLNLAPPSERDQWRLIGKGLGVHWDVLDEDISLDNLLLAHSHYNRGAYSRGVLV